MVENHNWGVLDIKRIPSIPEPSIVKLFDDPQQAKEVIERLIQQGFLKRVSSTELKVNNAFIKDERDVSNLIGRDKLGKLRGFLNVFFWHLPVSTETHPY